MSIVFCLSCLDAHFSFCSCSALSAAFFFFSSFLRLGEGRPLPPLRTTTLIQTRAPQQLHTQELGFCSMQLATISNPCAKQKGKVVSQELDTRVNGVPRAGETRDDGKRKEDQITSPTEPLTPTHWGQKNHTGFLKFQSHHFFFVPEVVDFYIVLFLSVPQWHFTNTFLIVLKFQAPLVFGWPAKSILFDFITQKSFK